MTSLAEQLKRLAIPQTKVFNDTRQRASLLFDPVEAATLSRDAVYSIGTEGISELISVDHRFIEFKEKLFNDEAKFFQRVIESKDVNKKLDRTISKFCLRLTPYLLLKSSHKALEWLIYRYQIHELNATQLFALILPYHEANIFVRILQLVDLKVAAFSSWSWLEPLQKHGLHLPRQVIINHAKSDSSFLRFICESTEKALKEHVKTGTESQLRTQLAFYSSIVVGVFSSGRTDDHILTVVLPYLMAGLDSRVPDYKAASFMALGQLISNNQLESALSSQLLKKFIQEEEENLLKQKVFLLLMMFQRQDPFPSLTYEMAMSLEWVLPVLADLSQSAILVGPMIYALVQALMDHIILIINTENHDSGAQVFCWSILEQVSLDVTYAGKIFVLLDSYYERLKPSSKNRKRKSSNCDEDPTGNEAAWLKLLIEMVASKYASIFDKVHDTEFQNIRRQWMGDEQDKALDDLISSLVRKCCGPDNAEAWRQLKPMLLKSIDDKRYFKAWCKASPVSEALTLLIILERILRSGNDLVARNITLKSISDTRFCSQNINVIFLKTLFDEKPAISNQDAISAFVETWNKESSKFPITSWIGALHELHNCRLFPASNDIWPLALRMLFASIPEKASEQLSVDITSALAYVGMVKAKRRLNLLSELLNCIKSLQLNPKNWYDLSESNIELCLRVKALDLYLQGVHESSKLKDQYIEQFNIFLAQCFRDMRDAWLFIAAVSAGLPFPYITSSIISPLLQIRSLHWLWLQFEQVKTETVISVWEQLVCYLIMNLGSDSMAIRTAAGKLLKTFSEFAKTHKKLVYCRIIREMAGRGQEMAADASYVSIGLHCALSSSDAFTGEEFLSVLTSCETPLYVVAKLSCLLDTVTSTDVLRNLAPMAKRALTSKNDLLTSNSILASYWKRLNSESSSALEDENVWDLAKESLGHFKCDHLCPAITLIKVINKELFIALPQSRKISLLQLLVATRADTESAPVSSAIVSACRKLPLDGGILLPLLEAMVVGFPSAASNTVPESRPWRLGISLLEIIQGRKKLRDGKKIVRPLFSLLKFCLDQEEQTPFEYSKQLILGCLLDICERHLTGLENLDPAILDVEYIVECLRASPNPQTHHHALLLLSCLGSIIPTKVMHNMMVIFTFMGSSVARLDDEYSVQVVTKVVESIVPVLVQSLPNESVEGDAVVADVMRIFVWSLQDVPQHRRSPIFSRLVATLDPDRSLWIFLLLLVENYVLSGHKAEKSSEGNMPASLLLGMELALAQGPVVVLNTALKLIRYLTVIPLKEMYPARIENSPCEQKKSDGLFEIRKHTPKQLRHYCYTLFTFLNSLLSDQNLIIRVRELESSEAENLETVFKDSIAALLLYAPTCSAQDTTQLAKYWKVITSLAYDVLDRLVALVSSETLVGVIKKLLKHSEDALRRKAVELLNVHIQTHRGGFSQDEKQSLKKLVPNVLTIVTSPGEFDSVEGQTLQQTALLSIRLLAKVLAAEDPDSFKQVLTQVSLKCKSSGHILASAALTVADLVAQLKARSVAELPSFLPSLLKSLTKYTAAESTDLVLMSLCAAIYRVVESLAAFLSPYMDKLLYCVSSLATRWPEATDLNRKVLQIRQKLASSVPDRVLIPSLARSYQLLLKEENFVALGPLMLLLADSLNVVPDVSKLLPELTPFLLQVLQIRSDTVDGIIQVSNENVLLVEGFAIDALMSLVLKLSELSFKPLYYQIFHWASEHPHRSITFYRLSSRLAEGLKGLFVLFAGHFLQNAAKLLEATNVTKTEEPCFGPGTENEAKAILLLESIIQTLHTVFKFDSTQFLSKEKFQALLCPLVDQLENTLGGAESLNERSERLLIPCLAQMTMATDDTQWKQLNYHLLSKTRNQSPLIRIAALKTIVEMAAKLGEDYLPLLPETIGSLAELLEDEDERVEEAMKTALRRMESDLGQPIREYFQ